MITLLIITIISALSAGNGPTFMPLNFTKSVKKVIDAKEQKNEILELYDKYETAQKELGKSQKQKIKDFWELTGEYETPDSILKAQLEQNRRIRHEFRLSNVDLELKIKSMLKDKEWNDILDRNDQAREKALKKSEKATESFDKGKQKLLKSINSVIDDKGKVEKIKEVVDNHFNLQLEAFEKYSALNYTENDTLRNLNSTKQEHIAITEQIDVIVGDYFDLYLSSRSKIIGIVSASEWKSIKKEFNDSMGW